MSCQTVQLIISQHSRHYSGYQPRPRHSKHIIQKNIMIQAMPLSQQRRNLSFLIRHSGVNARRLWWADFVVRGQRPAGCLRLGSVGRLHAAVSRLIHRHEGGIERFICQHEKAGEKSALYKVWTFVPTVWFQQRPAGKFCRIISSVESSDCRELVAISPVHLQLAARYLPLDSVLRATEVVICIWDCLIRSLY